MDEHVTLGHLAKMIDHSLLHPTMTDRYAGGLRAGEKIRRGDRLRQAVCGGLARQILEGSDVGVCAVIGFPHGNSTPAIKVAETPTGRCRDGGDRDRHGDQYRQGAGRRMGVCGGEIEAVNAACLAGGAILKVIFETDYLQDEHIIRLCEICSEHGVAFVKTSTGYGFVHQPNGFYSYQGATDHNLRLMRQHSAARRADQGGGRRAHAGRSAAGARAGRHADRRHGHRGDSG